MARDGYVGVKNLHLAPITNLTSLTYATPVDVGSKVGAVSIQADRSVSNDPAYANDEIWINADTDTGGTGTLAIREFGDTTVRELIADLTGYLVTSEGDILALANPEKKPCAILCEQSGYIHGRRKLFYHCELGKPNFSAQTKEGKTQVGQIEIPFTYYPIEIATGVMVTTRDSFYGNSTYADFFTAVVKTATPKSSSSS